MGRNKKDGLESLLDLHGCDFMRWPVAPPEERQAQIRKTPEYAGAKQVEDFLDTVVWPRPSEGISVRVMERIRQLEGREIALAARPSFEAFWQRRAFLLSAVVLSLCLGFTSGAHLNVKARQQAGYGYFSIGPASVFGTEAE